jgi:hypothetical protein
MAAPVNPPDHATLDLVEATLLFRRLFGLTITVFVSVGTFKSLGSRLDPDTQMLTGALVTLFVLGVVILSAVTATRLAALLHLSNPLLYGMAAALPCPSLLVLPHFGSRMLPAWSAAGMSALDVLQPRHVLLQTKAPRRPVPEMSGLAYIGTLAIALASIGVVATLVGVIDTDPLLPPSSEATPSPAMRPAPDTSFYRELAIQAQPAFEAADGRLSQPGDAIAFGNNASSEQVAQQISESFEKEVRQWQRSYPEYGQLSSADHPKVYLHMRPEHAAVLMRLQQFETFDEKTRSAWVNFAWRAATDRLRGLGVRGLAVALRGAGPYAAVTWGDHNEEAPRQIDTRTSSDTTALAAFFIEGRLPRPVVAPSAGSVGARLLEQRRGAPLHGTAEWQLFVGAKSEDSATRDRRQAIQRYATAEDVEGLLQAIEASAIPADDVRAAFYLLTRLSSTLDARIGSEQERRLAVALRARCLDAQTNVECPFNLRRDWARLDRPFLEDTFEQRLTKTAKVDRTLWDLLLETRLQADRERWLRIIEAVAQISLKQGRGAYAELPYWVEADPAALEREALAMSPGSVTADIRLWLAQALLSTSLVKDKSDASGRALSKIVALGGKAGERARVAREILGLDTQDRIEALARKWRETRSVKALGEFYSTYVDVLPVGAPFDKWIELLGETGPEATRRPTSFTVKPSDSTSTLYVELDARGRLFAISFD